MNTVLILLMLSLPLSQCETGSNVPSKFKLFTFSSCGGCCMETDARSTCNPRGDRCAHVGKIACVILLSLGMVSVEDFPGLQAVCID